MGDYKKDANAIEETLGISWEKEILSLDSGANKEGKLLDGKIKKALQK